MSQLTTCELMLNALNHRYSGCFPTDFWTREEPKEALMEYYGVKDFQQVKDILGITSPVGKSTLIGPTLGGKTELTFGYCKVLCVS